MMWESSTFKHFNQEPAVTKGQGVSAQQQKKAIESIYIIKQRSTPRRVDSSYLNFVFPKSTTLNPSPLPVRQQEGSLLPQEAGQHWRFHEERCDRQRLIIQRSFLFPSLYNRQTNHC